MMRSLTVKTLKGEDFRIDVAEESVMSDVKAKIAEVRGNDPASQVLISSGKTLKDDDTLASSVAAGGFLVLMVKRRANPVSATPLASPALATTATVSATPPGGTPAAAPAPTASATAAPAAVAAPPTAESSAVPASPAAAAAAPPASAAAAAAAPAGASASDELAIDPASVEMLTAMGFPEDQARAALRAAFNDVSRAASYLMEGIPDTVVGAGNGGDPRGGGDEALAAEMRTGAGADRGGGVGAADLAEALMGMGGGGEGNPLNFLRFHPQFEQLRGLVRDNPAMLPQVLQGLASQGPELIEMINEHPDDFLRLMNEAPDAEGQAILEMGAEGFLEGMDQEDDDEEGEAAGAADGGGGFPGAAAAGGVGGHGGAVTVELTEEENAAVENLMAMVPGAGRDQVIEAFIACDKNAEMAANLLFENAL